MYFMHLAARHGDISWYRVCNEWRHDTLWIFKHTVPREPNELNMNNIISLKCAYYEKWEYVMEKDGFVCMEPIQQKGKEKQHLD